MKERITIAIDKDLLTKLDVLATEQGRSRSNCIEMLLKDQVKIRQDIFLSLSDKSTEG